MDELNNIKGNEIDKLLPTEEEIADIRSALLRSKFPVPDIDAEWTKLSSKIKDKETQDETQEESPSRVHTYIWSAVAAVAACLACVFLLHTPTPELPENVAILSTPQSTNQVTLTDAHGKDKDVKDSALSFFARKQPDQHVEGRLLSMSTPHGKDEHVALVCKAHLVLLLHILVGKFFLIHAAMRIEHE